MRLLTKNSDYAIRALLNLAKEPNQYRSARDISADLNIPYEYLRKILQQLVKEGLVESREGGIGGFKLTRPPQELVVSDVMKIFQGPIQLSECMFRSQMCSNRANCVLRHNIMRIEALVQNEFQAMTFAGLLEQMGVTV